MFSRAVKSIYYRIERLDIIPFLLCVDPCSFMSIYYRIEREVMDMKKVIVIDMGRSTIELKE